jgi:hypothetical protein
VEQSWGSPCSDTQAIQDGSVKRDVPPALRHPRTMGQWTGLTLSIASIKTAKHANCDTASRYCSRLFIKWTHFGSTSSLCRKHKLRHDIRRSALVTKIRGDEKGCMVKLLPPPSRNEKILSRNWQSCATSSAVKCLIMSSTEQRAICLVDMWRGNMTDLAIIYNNGTENAVMTCILSLQIQVQDSTVKFSHFHIF